MNKILLCLLFIAGPVHAYIMKAKNETNNKFAVDFLDIAGNSHATMILGPRKDDKRDVGGWCTQKIRVTIIKPNGGYGGAIDVKTPGKKCDGFDVYIRDLGIRVVNIVEDSVEKPFWGGEDYSQETENYSVSDLLKVTTENSIITNHTNAQIFLFNAPSLGSGAKDGVPINSGATIPFYLNAGSAGEELVIKGNGSGTVSFGNDYANHKTRWIGSTNISKFQVINGEGDEINKKLDAKAQLVIDPLERLDITTPSGDWEIRLKVAEEIN